MTSFETKIDGLDDANGNIFTVNAWGDINDGSADHFDAKNRVWEPGHGPEIDTCDYTVIRAVTTATDILGDDPVQIDHMQHWNHVDAYVRKTFDERIRRKFLEAYQSSRPVSGCN